MRLCKSAQHSTNKSKAQVSALHLHVHLRDIMLKHSFISIGMKTKYTVYHTGKDMCRLVKGRGGGWLAMCASILGCYNHFRSVCEMSHALLIALHIVL